MKGGAKSLKEFKANAERVAKLAETGNMEAFFEYACKQMGARFLERVIPDTPAEENETIYYDMRGATGIRRVKGGALRRGWVHSSGPGTDPTDAEVKSYINGKAIDKAGRLYEITLSNNVEYASYVEYGHRQNIGQFVPWLGKPDASGIRHGAVLKKYKVDGQFFMTNAANALEDMAEGLAAKIVDEYINKKL